MKRLLSIAVFTAVSAAALLPLSASAQTRVQVTIGSNVPVHTYHSYNGYDRSAYGYQQRPTYVYAPNASGRDGRYVQQRHWTDRNGDGYADRRAGADRDRDGIRDRYDRDLDNDGIANRYDRDMDGDGVPNRRDRRPDNRYRY